MPKIQVLSEELDMSVCHSGARLGPDWPGDINLGVVRLGTTVRLGENAKNTRMDKKERSHLRHGPIKMFSQGAILYKGSS